ncbi:hypothetical protein ABSA28_00026 [Candidatus Hepatincolaceae symbiont of Richtersius coronifer]
MLESYLKHRSLKLSYNCGVYILLILEPLIIYSIYKQQYILTILLIVGYFTFHLPLNLAKYKQKGMSFHIQRGVFIVIDGIYKRKVIMNFYLLIILLSYLSMFYLIAIHSYLGFLVFGLIYLGKVLLYHFLCYNFSKETNNYANFDQRFLTNKNS